ncbi:hypothetical protein MANY_49040 [Mycolicibacterium anyangense]|uniref:Uncharacterized protein n=1 Tax=Mycolicibacterium anyangense TaxID=1431246 RepID=A0A6N4WHB4_9MYCO|nr:hypothetical protein MANY_49040 [Mycolicibacterium anyangense]
MLGESMQAYQGASQVRYDLRTGPTPKGVIGLSEQIYVSDASAAPSRAAEDRSHCGLNRVC